MLEYVPLAGSALLRAARGGAEIGPATLARFFVLHVAVLPIAMLLLLAFHFWLVRKAGGVILPRGAGDRASPRGPLVPTSPDLTQREGAAALAVVAAVLLLAAVWNAPLLAQANPGMSPNPAKAPWYFMGVQELLVHLHPAFGAVVVPLLGLGLLLVLAGARAGGRRPADAGSARRAVRGTRSSPAVVAALGTVAAVVVNEPLRRGPPWFPGLPPAVRRRRDAARRRGASCSWAWPGSRVAAAAPGSSRCRRPSPSCSPPSSSSPSSGVFFRGQGMALVMP